MKKTLFLLALLMLSVAGTSFAQYPPWNDECYNAHYVSPDGSCVYGSTVGATPGYFSTGSCIYNGADVWFAFTATGTTMDYTVTPNSGGSVEIALLEGSCSGSFMLMGSNCGYGALSGTFYGLTSGTTYYYTITTDQYSTTDFSACVNTYTPAPVIGNYDCATAIELCSKETIREPVSVNAIGVQEVNQQNSCWGSGGERRSKWYKFTVQTTGSLTFNINPLISNDDYDWAIWDITNGCNNKGSAIACNWSGCRGSTGLSFNPAAEPGALTTCSYAPWVNTTVGNSNPITVTAGRTYALLVDNYSQTSNGFEMSFGGTSVFQPKLNCCVRTYFSNTGASAILGAAGTQTTLNANGGTMLFDGAYHVRGTLYLTNGTFKLQPKTRFYVEGTYSGSTVTGAAIIIGQNASLELDNATLTAACDNMWKGIEADTRYSHVQFISKNNSEVSNAYTGVQNANSTGMYSFTYQVTNTQFFNNITHFKDPSFNSHQVSSFIRNCTFDSNPVSMKIPYQQTSSYNRYFTYEAIRLLAATGTVNQVAVENNTINNAVYGIVANYQDNKILLSGNTLTNIYATGLWTGQSLEPVMGLNNTINLNPDKAINTVQVNPNATAIGLFAELRESFTGNTVNGVQPNNTAAFKHQIGMRVQYGDTYTSNTLRNVSVGLNLHQAVSNSNTALYFNLFENCLKGVSVTSGTASNYVMRCNTFSNPANYAGVWGIVAEQNAYLNDLGTPSNPNGNRFSNVTNPLGNDGTNGSFIYYRYSSSQEAVSSVGGNIGGQVSTVSTNVANPVNACGGGNGVNTLRLAPVAYEAIREMMEKLQARQGSFEEQMRYQQQILHYHQERNLLGSLETYVQALPAHNLPAYNALALYLMEHYRLQKQETQAARLRNDLLAYNPQSQEITNQVQYFDVMGRLMTAGREILTARDSTDLAKVSLSGTSAADLACLQLRYYYPHAACTGAAPPAADRKAGPDLNNPAAGAGSYLGQAYPNPARTEATVAYSLPAGSTEATLTLHSLVKGERLREYRLPTGTAEGSLTLDLSSLGSGVYLYTLTVDGKPVDRKRMVVVK